MKTLKSKFSDIVEAQAEIDRITIESGYPDNTGTERYAEPATLPDLVPVYDENGNQTGTEQPPYQLTVNHRVQTENLVGEIPAFDPDLESEFNIKENKITIPVDADEIIPTLLGKIKNMVAEIQGQRTSATDTPTIEIKADGNTIVTQGNAIENKFCVVKTPGGKLQMNQFIEAATIETNHTIETGALNEITPANLPDLPATGDWCEGGKMYNNNGQAVYCVQGHNRTIHDPSTIPNLFSVFRAETGQLEWIENELVEVGTIRFENGVEYECIQAHMTLPGWAPSNTPTLWQTVQSGIPVWQQPTGAHDAYNIGDQVYYPTANNSIYESLINANVWSPAVYPAGWQLIN